MLECSVFQESNYKKRVRRGPRRYIKMLAHSLIRQARMTDQEMCDYIKTKYPEASTSVKCIQYYRYYMRTEGLIPPAKCNRRKDKIIIMWELIPVNLKYSHLELEGTYTGKQLIAKCRELLMTHGYSKIHAWEEIYSHETCKQLLNRLGWEYVEIETVQKCKEYIDE
jgi:hypothetical protein